MSDRFAKFAAAAPDGESSGEEAKAAPSSPSRSAFANIRSRFEKKDGPEKARQSTEHQAITPLQVSAHVSRRHLARQLIAVAEVVLQGHSRRRPKRPKGSYTRPTRCASQSFRDLESLAKTKTKKKTRTKAKTKTRAKACTICCK